MPGWDQAMEKFTGESKSTVFFLVKNLITGQVLCDLDNHIRYFSDIRLARHYLNAHNLNLRMFRIELRVKV